MAGDALWYEAAQVVGITNALNVAADGLGAAGLTPVKSETAPAEVRAVFDEIRAFFGAGEPRPRHRRVARGLPAADGGRPRPGHHALPGVDPRVPDRRGAHVPGLDVFVPGAPRRGDTGVLPGDRAGPRLRQPLQRHRRVPDAAGQARRGDPVARESQARAALRAAPV